MDKVEDDKISLTHSHLHKHTQKGHKQTKKKTLMLSQLKLDYKKSSKVEVKIHPKQKKT